MDARQLASVVPAEVLDAYIRETFPEQMHALMRTQVASTWIQPDRLLQFATEYFQRKNHTAQPSAIGQTPVAPQQGLPRSQNPTNSNTATQGGTLRFAAQSPPSDTVSDDPIGEVVLSTCSLRTVSMDRVLDFPRQGGSSALKDIEEVYNLHVIPECWPVPRVPTAYVLDLTESLVSFSKENGEEMSMDAIIKKHDQDSWGGGYGGSRDPKKQTSVALLGGAKCMQSRRKCNGLFVCSEFDDSHFDNYERFAPDWEKTSTIFAASQKLNGREGTSALGICATFYNLLMRTECPQDGCKADVALHQLEKLSFEGKTLVAGCAGVPANDLAHRRYPVPRCVDEKILSRMFESQGRVDEDFNEDFEDPCAFMVHPRTGKRGRCNFLHIKKGHILQPSLRQHECNAIMTVYFPVNTADRRAVVVIAANTPHSHPSFPSYKLSYAAKEKVEQAIRAIGSLSTSVQALRTAPLTSEITGTKSLGELHGALDQDRTIRSLIQKERKAVAPLGTGLTAVFDCMRKQRDTLPHDSVYIQEVSDNGIPLIICMLPRIVREVHSARSLVVDMTYKTLAGEFKLWHVVMFSAKYNRRLVVARIFSTHESEDAFLKMWDGLFDCIAKVTGRPLCFPVFHKKGNLHVVACDGDAAQAAALARSVQKRHDSSISGLTVHVALELLPYFFRTCNVHSDANLDKLAPACDAATIAYLRTFYYMNSDEEVAKFHEFCRSSSFPAVRNWHQNKVVHPWYLPSLVQHLSKIPEDIWHTTRGETNLAESSHAATNAAIGTRLQLLVAINRLHQHDLSMAAALDREDSSSGIVKDKHNTFQNTLRSNLKRKVRATERVIEEQKLQKTIGQLDQQIDFHAAEKRKLQEEKENLTATSSGKKAKIRGRKHT